jgi:hypothetical protein
VYEKRTRRFAGLVCDIVNDGGGCLTALSFEGCGLSYEPKHDEARTAYFIKLINTIFLYFDLQIAMFLAQRPLITTLLVCLGFNDKWATEQEASTSRIIILPGL